jgi:hypothetical protein
MKKLKGIDKVVSEMLKENTGSHFLDSGSAYGRNWERNQKVDFESAPKIFLKFSQYGEGSEIEFTRSIYDFLTENLVVHTSLQRSFSRFCNLEENKGLNWFELEHKYIEKRKEKGLVVGGIYGDGDPIRDNTYNHDNVLSQDFVYSYWTDKVFGQCILLSVHGGCDIRGGYTRPRAFHCSDELSIFDYAEGSIYCSGDCKTHWTTDDSSHWYHEGCWGRNFTNLEDVPVTALNNCANSVAKELEVIDRYNEYLTKQVEMFPEDTAKKKGPKFVLRVDKETGEGYCPYCRGLLKGSGF